MKKTILAVLLGVSVCSSVPVSALDDPLSKYPGTIAVLRLLHEKGIQSSRTYLAFARQAHSEKKFNIESFFVALAASEIIRAETLAGMLKEMGIDVPEVKEEDVRVSTTKSNLKLITNIESADLDKRFSWMLDEIKKEGHAVAIAYISHIWKVKVQHRDLAKEILSSMESFFGIGAKAPDEFFVCQRCGSTLGEIPDLTCPVCQGPTSGYEKASAKWQFYSYVDNNGLLTDEEKAYARRVFDHIYSQVYEEQNVRFDGSILNSPLYQKWGLGYGRDFSLEEKVYLLQIEQTDRIWQEYSKVDLNRLEQADTDFVKEMHDKYGAGPVDLRSQKLKEEGTLSEDSQAILDIVETVSGRSMFEDKDLVFLRRWVAATTN